MQETWYRVVYAELVTYSNGGCMLRFLYLEQINYTNALNTALLTIQKSSGSCSLHLSKNILIYPSNPIHRRAFLHSVPPQATHAMATPWKVRSSAPKHNQSSIMTAFCVC